MCECVYMFKKAAQLRNGFVCEQLYSCDLVMLQESDGLREEIVSHPGSEDPYGTEMFSRQQEREEIVGSSTVLGFLWIQCVV